MLGLALAPVRRSSTHSRALMELRLSSTIYVLATPGFPTPPGPSLPNCRSTPPTASLTLSLLPPAHCMQCSIFFRKKVAESVKLFPKHVTYQESDWLLQIT
jgi:hypothetical protein